MKRLTMLVAALCAIGYTSAICAVPASTDDTVVRAQGNPWLFDFMSIQSKRGDLRIAVAKKGLDAAFSDWLHTEHPYAYRAAVKRADSASAPARTGKGSCCTPRAACCAPACCKS